MTKTTNDIWEMFCPLRALVDGAETCDEQTMNRWQKMRNSIVATFYHLVVKEAKRVHNRIPNVAEDAHASEGVSGLYDAVDKYDPDRMDPKTGKTIKFETYASPRIRGSMIDAIRRDDWVPRLVRQRSKEINEHRDTFLASNGRLPTDDEMASALKVTVGEYREMAKSSEVKSVQSLDAGYNAMNRRSVSDDITLMDCIDDKSHRDPLDSLIDDEMYSKLFGKGFNRVEQRIIRERYLLRRNMKEIADGIDLSESRISQMTSNIVKVVKERIKANPKFFGPKLLAIALEP
jgi:RNA polymerase sigma factor for flagellar operon FliA